MTFGSIRTGSEMVRDNQHVARCRRSLVNVDEMVIFS